jgi:signal transduction histidine kinase
MHITGIRIQDKVPDLRKTETKDGRDSSVEERMFHRIPGISWSGLEGPYHLPNDLRMPHQINTISFQFGSNDIRGKDNTMYSYILEGEDSSWSEPMPRPFSHTYFNLSPGSYTFRVRMKGFNGMWSEPSVLSFEILLPWWRKWWALLLYVAVFGLAAWILAGYRSRQLRQENATLEAKVGERTMALEESIRELKTTQAQMIQREKMASLGELTAGIAHEIQNPLNFVNNFSEVNHELLAELKEELAKGKADGVEDIINDLASNNTKISHHGKRADNIIKSMLQHSRSVTGDKELTDLNELGEEYLQLSYHGMRAKEKDFNAQLSTSFAEGLPQVKMVPQDIGRVLMNLLNNAFYAARKSRKQGQPGYQPTVKVATGQKGQQVWIAITDNGDGIPQDLMKKIFQPFFTTKPTGEGTGLGLSLSFDIVTKGHNGQLTVQTEPGEGTTFTVYLPKD